MNVCENGDHPAPEGQRFCSAECQADDAGEAVAFAGAGACFGPPDEPESTAQPLDSGPGWQDGRIATMDAFHRAARDYREALEAASEVDAQHQAEIAPWLRKIEAAKARADAALKPLRKQAQWLEGRLLGFAQQHRAEILKGQDRRAKSALVGVSGVRVAWRHDPGGYRWDDSMKESERKAKLLEWAVAGHPVYVRVVPEVAADLLKADLTRLRKSDEPPETPPGLKYVEPADVLSITTDADKDE